MGPNFFPGSRKLTKDERLWNVYMGSHPTYRPHTFQGSSPYTLSWFGTLRRVEIRFWVLYFRTFDCELLYITDFWIFERLYILKQLIFFFSNLLNIQYCSYRPRESIPEKYCTNEKISLVYRLFMIFALVLRCYQLISTWYTLHRKTILEVLFCNLTYFTDISKHIRYQCMYVCMIATQEPSKVLIYQT